MRCAAVLSYEQLARSWVRFGCFVETPKGVRTVIALLLALGSSLAYGCADFLGGLGSRKAHVLRTVMVAA